MSIIMDSSISSICGFNAIRIKYIDINVEPPQDARTIHRWGAENWDSFNELRYNGTVKTHNFKETFYAL